MGYRAEWLKHEGLLSVHSEVLLHAVDRMYSGDPIRLLLVGVGNGGQVEVWHRVLPEQSRVTVIDPDPRWDGHELGVLVGDVTDRDWLSGVLRGQWFDLIVDSTGVHSPYLWPYLVPSGHLLYEGYERQMVLTLVEDVARDHDSWLPTEEIMSLTVMPDVLIVEKRNPRVIPYLDVIVGSDDHLISESTYASQGARRVTPYKETPDSE